MGEDARHISTTVTSSRLAFGFPAATLNNARQRPSTTLKSIQQPSAAPTRMPVAYLLRHLALLAPEVEALLGGPLEVQEVGLPSAVAGIDGVRGEIEALLSNGQRPHEAVRLERGTCEGGGESLPSH